MIPRPPRSTHCPYTTLFRSGGVPAPETKTTATSAPAATAPSNPAASPTSDAEAATEAAEAALVLRETEEGATNLTNVDTATGLRSEEHTSELQSRQYLVCRL